MGILTNLTVLTAYCMHTDLTDLQTSRRPGKAAIASHALATAVYIP